MRLVLLLPLCLILSAATPVHQLDGDSDDITSALFSPSPTPSVTITPLASVSITPTADPSLSAQPSLTAQPSPSPDPTTSDLSTPLPSVTPEPETLSTEASPTPSVEPSFSITATPSPADELIPMDDGFGDSDDGVDDDDDGSNDNDEGDAFGFSPNQVSEEATPKSVDGTIASAPSSISALALVGIALAILAPAVIIFWFVRRRSGSGFQNIPRVDTDTYQGTSHGTFTVA